MKMVTVLCLLVVIAAGWAAACLYAVHVMGRDLDDREARIFGRF